MLEEPKEGRRCHTDMLRVDLQLVEVVQQGLVGGGASPVPQQAAAELLPREPHLLGHALWESSHTFSQEIIRRFKHNDVFCNTHDDASVKGHWESSLEKWATYVERCPGRTQAL